MLAGWPTMTATCWTPRRIGSPTWAQWHLPPTRRPRARRPRRRTNTRANAIVVRKVASSARAHALASQGEIRTPAVAAAARLLPITDREREIAMLVVAGLSNHQVADRLFVSVRTVDGHLYRIFAKLDISSRDQLIHLLRLERSGA